jgi:hypothetical protein
MAAEDCKVALEADWKVKVYVKDHQETDVSYLSIMVELVTEIIDVTQCLTTDVVLERRVLTQIKNIV